MRAEVTMTWYPRSDIGLHATMHRPGVYGAIYMTECPNGLGTLNTTSATCPIGAVAEVMGMAMEPCRCVACRPIAEEVEGGLRMVRA